MATTEAELLEGRVIDPDELKMPERAVHRRAVDLIALAATRLLGPDVRVFRDLNWYPPDGGAPTAPDVMVLPAGAVETSPRSYRQGADGPPPLVLVEVPSSTDSYGPFRAKAKRAQELGSVVYIVVVDGPAPVVLRLGVGDDEPVDWVGRAIPELGGLKVGFVDGALVVETPSGERAGSDVELLALAADLVDVFAARAEAETQRADALAERLRALGVDPDRPAGG
ncbi:MAG: Uma2 family endonuclease [Acidimicrobiales bacterium]